VVQGEKLRGAEKVAGEDLATLAVANAVEVRRDLRDDLAAGRRVVGDCELPEIGVAGREARRGRAVGDDARIVRAVDVEALDAVGRARVDVGLKILRVLDERAGQTAQELVDRPIAAHLTRQAALEAHPLAVDVLVALKAGAVALDAGERLYLDDLFSH
jgi:NADH/NAD ratio-sensing transcriptional regulator Rex